MKIIQCSRGSFDPPQWFREIEGWSHIPPSLGFLCDPQQGQYAVLGDNQEIYKLQFLENPYDPDPKCHRTWHVKRFVIQPEKCPRKSLNLWNCALGAIDTHGRSVEYFKTKREALKALEEESVEWTHHYMLDEQLRRHEAVMMLYDVMDEIEEAKHG